MRHYDGQDGPFTHVWRISFTQKVMMSQLVGFIQPDCPVVQKTWVQIKERDHLGSKYMSFNGVDIKAKLP